MVFSFSSLRLYAFDDDTTKGHINGQCGNNNRFKFEDSDIEPVESDQSSFSEDDDNEIAPMSPVIDTLQSMQSNENKNDRYDDDAVTESEDDDSTHKESQRKTTHSKYYVPTYKNKDGSQRAQRLPLDKAMEDTEKKEKWSDCRKVAWDQQESNPNAHYYRFLLRGAKQSKGSWTDEEHKLFMKRTLDFGVNYKWGLIQYSYPRQSRIRMQQSLGCIDQK